MTAVPEGARVVNAWIAGGDGAPFVGYYGWERSLALEQAASSMQTVENVPSFDGPDGRHIKHTAAAYLASMKELLDARLDWRRPAELQAEMTLRLAGPGHGLPGRAPPAEFIAKLPEWKRDYHCRHVRVMREALNFGAPPGGRKR